MKSIRRQLTLSMLTGFGLLLLCSSVAIYFFTRLALLHEFDAGLREQALTLMSLTESGEEGIHLELPNTFFPGGKQEAVPQFFELWATNGSVCARRFEGGDLPRQYGPPDAPACWNLDLPGDADGRAIGVKFTLKTEDGEVRPATPEQAILVVAADRRELDQTLATLAAVLVTAGLLTMIITVPLVRISLRRGQAPLGELARQAAAINAESLQTRFPVVSLPEELQPIAARLNDLLARLEASFERERRFSADLAHELRTPLAELRTQAEVELAWPEGAEGEKSRDILNVTLQMEAMVTRLLEMTRCESGKIPLQLDSVPLAKLIEEVWQPLAAAAKAKSIAIQFKVSAEASLQTDPTLFRSILVNLFSNLAEYTPPNGQGEICWDSSREELTVTNTVQDLVAADVPHFFERLWRKDKSRSGGEHCGLGLALSRAYAELLEFDLQAQLKEGQILTMVLRRRRRT